MFEFFDLTQYLERCFFSFEQLGFIYLAHFFCVLDEENFLRIHFFSTELHDSVEKKPYLNVLPGKLACPLKNRIGWMLDTFPFETVSVLGDMVVFGSV